MRNLYLACPALLVAGFFSPAHSEEYPRVKSDDPIIAEVFTVKIRHSEMEKMGGIIFGTLLEQYAKAHKIEPTRDEIDAFISGSRQQQKQHREHWKREKSVILKKLESETLSESERNRLISQLETLNSLLNTDPKIEQYKKDNPKISRKMEEDSAKHFIRVWKLNTALFRQYGGRVIFQQAGPEPLDAYREFLKEHEKRGSFRIHDKSLEPSFWNYFVNDRMHAFISKTREEGEKIFKTPWWLLDKPLEE